MMEFKITAASSVGCIRDNNEDMILVNDQFVRNDSLSLTAPLQANSRLLLALADGMGGHNRGEVASSDTLHNLQFFFGDIPGGLDNGGFNESIFNWLASMNNLLEGKGNSDPQYKNMGTTLVALAYYEGKFYSMNCGDSRLYRYRDGQLLQMTNDHSLSNMLGQHSHSHVITNCIGGGCRTSFVDIIDCTIDIKDGDTLMLCSDGLTDMLADADIENMLNSGYDAQRLCKAAENAGGLDNVSVLLATLSSNN